MHNLQASYLDKLKDCKRGGTVFGVEKAQNTEQLCIEAAVSETQQEAAQDGHFFAEDKKS